MSKIGRQSIPLPKDVTVAIRDDAATVSVKGPKGELAVSLPPQIHASTADGVITIRPEDGVKEEDVAAFWGLGRSLVANAVKGVSEGHTVELELVGVGYRAEGSGDALTLQVGFSHPVEVQAPAHVSFSIKKNIITVSGIDKQQVGETAARIRRVRPPEPYKGKGIRRVGEHVRRKAGKVAGAADAA